MAMQPIDLQILFSQLDKVARNQTQMREGLQLQANLSQIQNQKKMEELVQSVNEAQDMGFGVAKVDNEKSQGQAQDRKKKEEEEEREKATGIRKSPFRDPTLGRNIDISG